MRLTSTFCPTLNKLREPSGLCGEYSATSNIARRSACGRQSDVEYVLNASR